MNRTILPVAIAFLSLAACSAGKEASEATDLGAENTGSDSAADTLASPASTTAIKFGEIKTTSFTRLSKYRAFTFEGQKDQVVNVYVDGLSGLDTVAYLYPVSKVTGRAFGYPVAWNDDTYSSGWTLNTNKKHNELSSSFEVKLTETRKYMLITTTYEQAYSGKAELTVKASTPVPSVVQVTTAQLTSNPSAYAGKRVSVTDDVDGTLTACTKIACPTTNPCCNACSATFRLGASNIALENVDTSAPWSCTGNSCSLTCKGFSNQQPGKYTLVGTFTVGQYGDAVLTVESKTAANCHPTGCSGTVCSNTDVFTTCVYRPEFACYAAHSTCGVRTGGECGWDQTASLLSCLQTTN